MFPNNDDIIISLDESPSRDECNENIPILDMLHEISKDDAVADDEELVLEVSTIDSESVWRFEVVEKSMPEVNGTVEVKSGDGVSWWKTLSCYVGPGALIAVGYMDPGNWSTDIAGGSAYGYSLLFVIMISSFMAMFLQALAVKCGLVTARDLPQACRDSYPQWLNYLLWFIAEIAILATDVAEVLGSAIALRLLFGIPLIAGCCVTALDVILLLMLHGKNFRILECFVGLLVLVIAVCYAVELGISNPDPIPLLTGFLPSQELFADKGMLLIAVGIMGATVMPHNLYLHSSIIQTRATERDSASIRQAIKYSVIDSTFCLSIAWFVNSAILIVAGAAFHANGLNDVANLDDASHLLDPIMGSAAASKLFGIALLASGQNSTITGTLTGQIVMEGFCHWKISPFYRRMLTRLIAIVPAVAFVAVGGSAAANNLLIYSQVVLSFALPFAVFPLVHITSSKARMGQHVNSWSTHVIACSLGVLIVVLNVLLVIPF